MKNCYLTTHTHTHTHTYIYVCMWMTIYKLPYWGIAHLSGELPAAISVQMQSSSHKLSNLVANSVYVNKYIH